MLKLLTEAFGPSGYEDDVRDIIKCHMSKFCDEINVDNLGNLICHKNGKKVNGKSIVLCAHMDEVGFIVGHITEDGYLKIKPIGGMDAAVWASKRVVIGRNRIIGVVCLNPIHLSKKNDTEIKFADLYIDIGTTSKADAEKYVNIGDYGCFDSNYVEFGDYMVKAKALDDRVGCYIMTKIAEKSLNADIYYVFTVQEELGCRGAKTAIKNIDVDFAVVIESTTCADYPNVDKYEFTTKLGNGPALSMRDSGTYADIGLTEEIAEIGTKSGIPFQYKQNTTGGNDSSALQLIGKGLKVTALSVPCRYMHSGANVESLKDIENLEKLLLTFIESKVNNQWLKNYQIFTLRQEWKKK